MCRFPFCFLVERSLLIPYLFRNFRGCFDPIVTSFEYNNMNIIYGPSKQYASLHCVSYNARSGMRL